jgi:hypothetical protein
MSAELLAHCLHYCHHHHIIIIINNVKQFAQVELENELVGYILPVNIQLVIEELVSF